MTIGPVVAEKCQVEEPIGGGDTAQQMPDNALVLRIFEQRTSHNALIFGGL
jgi:hypothetical protein